MIAKYNIGILLFITFILFASCTSTKYVATINSYLVENDAHASFFNDMFIPPQYRGVKEMYIYYNDDAENPIMTSYDSLFFDKKGKLLRHVNYDSGLHGKQTTAWIYSYDQNNRIKEVRFEDNDQVLFRYIYRKNEIERIRMNGEKEVRKYKNQQLQEREEYLNDSLVRTYKYTYNDQGYLTEIYNNRWNDSIYTKYKFTYEQGSDNSVFVKGIYFIRNSKGLYEEYKSVIPNNIFLSYFHRQVMYYSFCGINYDYQYDEKGNCVNINSGYSVTIDIKYY